MKNRYYNHQNEVTHFLPLFERISTTHRKLRVDQEDQVLHQVLWAPDFLAVPLSLSGPLDQSVQEHLSLPVSPAYRQCHVLLGHLVVLVTIHIIYIFSCSSEQISE